MRIQAGDSRSSENSALIDSVIEGKCVTLLFTGTDDTCIKTAKEMLLQAFVRNVINKGKTAAL